MMLEGWIMVGFIMVVVLLVVKLVNKKQQIATHMVIWIFIFMAMTVGYFVINQNLEINSFRDVVQAIKVYLLWITQIGQNVVETTGHAIDQEWFLNSTNSTG